MRPVIPHELKLRFKSYVTARSGLYFKDYDLRDLEDAIIKRMQDLSIASPLSYYDLVTKSEGREDEFRELLNLLTIKHTYFFRNEHQFKVLKERVLPEVLSGKTSSRRQPPDAKPSLRIWSAGCATGEEAYSIAMTALDVLGDTNAWDIEIFATDASTEALEKARRGEYSFSSVKPVPKDYIERYFEKGADAKTRDSYTVKNEVKRLVSFAYHNLISDEFPAEFDIIFCRNVVIYFELETTIGVMRRFHSSLNQNGFLFIGYSESLHFMSDRFRMEHFDDAIFYRKDSKRAAPAFEAAVPQAPQRRAAERALDELSRAELAAEIKAEAKKLAEIPKKIEEILVRAVKSYHMKEYDRALALAEEALRLDNKELDIYYLLAEIYLNKGNFAEAKRRLNEAIGIDPLFAPAHYLLGCIFIEEEMMEKARESLKKALYIKHDFPLAHFYLAHTFKTEGRSDDAIREYRNTLKTLSKVSFDDIIPYSGGFDAASLIGVCGSNIERLKMEMQ